VTMERRWEQRDHKGELESLRYLRGEIVEGGKKKGRGLKRGMISQKKRDGGKSEQKNKQKPRLCKKQRKNRTNPSIKRGSG